MSNNSDFFVDTAESNDDFFAAAESNSDFFETKSLIPPCPPTEGDPLATIAALPLPGMARGLGGARPRAGKKKNADRAPANPTPEQQQTMTAYQRYDLARAEKEEQVARSAKVKADLDEKMVVDRQSVRDATARAFATCSQAIDAIPDTLEREGIALDVCERVAEIINAAKEQLVADLERAYEDADSDD